MKKQCIVVVGILKENEEVVVMSAKVVVLVVDVEDHPTSTATTVVIGKISNVSVGHLEEGHMSNMKETT